MSSTERLGNPVDALTARDSMIQLSTTVDRFLAVSEMQQELSRQQKEQPNEPVQVEVPITRGNTEFTVTYEKHDGDQRLFIMKATPDAMSGPRVEYLELSISYQQHEQQTFQGVDWHYSLASQDSQQSLSGTYMSIVPSETTALPRTIAFFGASFGVPLQKSQEFLVALQGTA